MNEDAPPHDELDPALGGSAGAAASGRAAGFADAVRLDLLDDDLADLNANPLRHAMSSGGDQPPPEATWWGPREPMPPFPEVTGA